MTPPDPEARFDGPLLNQRWRLGPRLGAGGQAKTFLARDESVVRGERIVVVKELKLGGAVGWKEHDLFEREARVLKQLSHPGIPRCLDQFQAGPGELYLVMERAPGVTLKELAQRGRFDEPMLRDVMARVLEILIYLHGRSPPVVHRDLKPANLLRAEGGAISLVDFGGVREVLRTDGGSTVVGTFGYLAPEQLHGEATAATDLYGLGATMVALAGGVEPENVPRRGLKMDLERHLAHLSPDLRALLSRMLEPDPEARLRSAKEALDQLRNPPKPGSRDRAARAARAPEPDEPVEANRELEAMPAPVRGLLRVLLIAIGALGYAGFTVLDVVFLPFLFALVRAFSADARRPRIDEVQDKMHAALAEGRRGFHRLQGQVLRGRRRELPPRR